MNIKDIIKITMFSIIGFIFSMVGAMMVGIFGAYSMYVHSSLGSVLIGPVYFVMCHKVYKRFTAFLFCLIHGLIYLFMGMWPMLVVLFLAGLLGEITIGAVENYHNDKKIALSFVLSQLLYGMHGALLMLAFGPAGLAKQFPTMFTLEQAQQMQMFMFNIKNISIMMIIQIIGGILGAILGIYIYKKFFKASTNKKGIL